MKKTIFSFAIAAVAALMVSCGGKTENNAPEATAEGEQATEQKAEEEVAAKTEDRAWYTVDIPTSWEAKQYASEMIVKKEGAELNFKEQAKGELAKWLENVTKDAESPLDDITTGDITWKVFKNVKEFKTVYVAQVNDGVVRVGSSLEDANDADVLKILGTVKGK